MTAIGASPSSRQAGFTLLELSIVLVIIGLIVGGVLVGQDLIKGAEIRSTVAQIEKYNTAVNTFRGKYNFLPGDIPAQKAVNFGLYELTVPGTGAGDGNGLLQDSDPSDDGTAATDTLMGERLVFWCHLSDAQLVDGAFSCLATLDDATALPVADVTATTMQTVMPPAKLGRGNYFMVYDASGTNFYQINGITAIASADGAVTLRDTMTPTEAKNIDTKIDDGKPATGIVRGMTEQTNTDLMNSVCANGDTCCETISAVLEYDTRAANGNTPTCGIRARFN